LIMANRREIFTMVLSRFQERTAFPGEPPCYQHLLEGV
jgi:hypothetical protein